MCKVIGCMQGIFKENYCEEHYKERKRVDEEVRKMDEQERLEEERKKEEEENELE